MQHGHSYKRCQKGVFIRYNLLLPKGFLLEVCQRGPHLYVLGSPLSSNLLSVCCFQYKFFHSFHLYSTLATTSNEFELVKHISIQNLLNTFPYKTCYMDKFFHKNYPCTPSKFSLCVPASNYHATRKEVQNTWKLL